MRESNEWMSGLIMRVFGQMSEKRDDGQVVGEWMSGWLNGLVGGWVMDEWFDGLIGGQIDKQSVDDD